MRIAAVKALILMSLFLVPGATGAQSVNQGFAAMEQGDFFAAFSALRRLERSGDPEATRLLNDIFLAPAAAPAPRDPVTPVPVAAPARRLPAVDESASASPMRSLRPVMRATSPGMTEPDLSARAHDLPLPLSEDSFRVIDAGLADIGHLLFFDPILSGNKDVACATCHHPTLGSGDGVSLGLGTGATGLGDARTPAGAFAAERRIPRNAPALWNLGAKDIRVLFHDGRLETDPDRPDGLLSQQGPLDYMELDSVLAAQVLFPVLSPEEMAGQPQDNPIGAAVHEERIHGDDGAWALLAARVDSVAEYRAAFTAWRGVERPVRISDIANAIAAFIEAEFRADQSPFDAYLRETAALSAQAGEGMRLFYGRGNCASCHSGSLLSDQAFHAMGQPPLGPGKDRDEEGYTRDIGRGGVTLNPKDNFAFRTPMLRNVMQTGPWGHAGAFSDMRDFLRHHLDPVAGLRRYEPQAVLPDLASGDKDYAPVENAALVAQISDAAARSMAQRPLVLLQDDEIELLVAFLEALTDESALAGRRGVPVAVPSGLPVDQ